MGSSPEEEAPKECSLAVSACSCLPASLLLLCHGQAGKETLKERCVQQQGLGTGQGLPGAGTEGGGALTAQACRDGAGCSVAALVPRFGAVLGQNQALSWPWPCCRALFLVSSQGWVVWGLY